MPMEMHHGDDQDQIFTSLIDDPIRKTVCSAASSAFRDGGPCMGMLYDARERSPDFNGEPVTESLALSIVVSDRLDKLPLSRIEEFDSHGRAR